MQALMSHEELARMQRWCLRPCICQQQPPLCLACETINTLLDIQKTIHQEYDRLAIIARATP